jgi:polyhydroxyalkanoate synthesis regulator phasin
MPTYTETPLTAMNAVNPMDLFQVVQKGMRVTLGATTSVVESLQNESKRSETISKLSQGQWPQLVDELAVKGEVAERDARALVDTLFAQRPATVNVTATPVTGPSIPVDLQQDIRDLTNAIAHLRQDLEKMRPQG